MLFEYCLDELAKLGTVSEEAAEKALTRYKALKENKPEAGQIARYSALGAAVAPAMHVGGNLLKGEGLSRAVSVAEKYNGMRGNVRAAGVGRSLAASAVTGAVGMGLVPIARHWLDQRAEKGKLQHFLHEREHSKTANSIVPNVAGLAMTPIGKTHKWLLPVKKPAEIDAMVDRMQHGMDGAATRAGGTVERIVGRAAPNRAGRWLGRVGGKITSAVIGHPIGGLAGSALPIPGGTALGIGAEEGAARLLGRIGKSIRR